MTNTTNRAQAIATIAASLPAERLLGHSVPRVAALAMYNDGCTTPAQVAQWSASYLRSAREAIHNADNVG